MAAVYYRYISYPLEIQQVINERRVQSTNPATNYATYYTTERYDDPLQAQQALALKYPPTHRIGPILDTQMPALTVPFRSVAPLGGQPGGGIEIITWEPLWLFGVKELGTGQWVL